MAKSKGKERILKATKEKQHVPYKRTPIRKSDDCSAETLQTIFIKKKREKAQINKRNKKEVTIGTTEIQRITRDYCEQLYANKMHNLEETDKFLEMYHPLRMNQEEIENMNRPITSNEMGLVIKKLPPPKKVQDQKSSQVNSTKYLEKR